MPVMISLAFSFRLNWLAICMAPLAMKVSRNDTIIIVKVFSLESHATTMAVKPRPPARVVEMVWPAPLTSMNPASPHSALDPCLKRLGVFGLFTNVWSCEDFGTTKSDPGIYRMAAERIGRPVDEIWFLDDNLNADRTAKEAGMLVCGVYDASSDEYTSQMKALCDAYINDFSELLEMEDK